MPTGDAITGLLDRRVQLIIDLVRVRRGEEISDLDSRTSRGEKYSRAASFVETPKDERQQKNVKLFVAEKIDQEEELIESRIAKRLNPLHDPESSLNQAVHRLSSL
jgi:hypothetical protein